MPCRVVKLITGRRGASVSWSSLSCDITGAGAGAREAPSVPCVTLSDRGRHVDPTSSLRSLAVKIEVGESERKCDGASLRISSGQAGLYLETLDSFPQPVQSEASIQVMWSLQTNQKPVQAPVTAAAAEEGTRVQLRRRRGIQVREDTGGDTGAQGGTRLQSLSVLSQVSCHLLITSLETTSLWIFWLGNLNVSWGLWIFWLGKLNVSEVETWALSEL